VRSRKRCGRVVERLLVSSLSPAAHAMHSRPDRSDVEVNVEDVPAAPDRLPATV
jgi:hypothetical protein